MAVKKKTRDLKKVKSLGERVMWLVVKAIGRKESQFVRILTHRWYPYLIGTIEVHVRHFVSQTLNLKQRELCPYYILQTIHLRPVIQTQIKQCLLV